MGLKTFFGGTHPPEYKEATKDKPIENAPMPSEVIIPLHQHTGAPCKPLVEKGERVLKGQKIGDSDVFCSAPIHSSVSGEVVAVESRLYFTGTKVLSVVIALDGKDEEEKLLEATSSGELRADKVRRIVREAGIVGLGGAAFPTHVKLTPPENKPIDSVIINGCECEPYLTCDHRLMLEETEPLVDGLKIIVSALGAKKGYFGTEANKPDAIDKLREATLKEENIEVVPLQTKYPQGEEKQLIKAILRREVPSGSLPFDIGAYVQNVGTTIAISRAVRKETPLYERVVTVAGGVKNPKNLRVKVGTPIKFLIDSCGGFEGEPGKVIVGGPMTGFAQFDLEVSVVKGTSGIIIQGKDEVFDIPEGINPCIRCARCVNYCPAHLMPNFIATYANIEMWNMVEDYRVFDCIECGTCAYVCPVKIPHIQLIRLAKAKILANRKE